MEIPMNTFSMNIAITISHAYVPYAYTLLLSLPAHDSAMFQVYAVSYTHLTLPTIA